MKVLLDTHVLLWWLSNDPILSQKARHTIENAQNIVFVSAASAWEIAIKKALGKLKAPDDLETAINISRFEVLPIHIKHAMGVCHLPLHHTDPFDRLLIAQATIEDLTLITHDDRMSEYNISIIKT